MNFKNSIRTVTIWALGLFCISLVTLAVGIPVQLLLVDTTVADVSFDLVGVLTLLSTAHLSARLSAKSPAPLAWKSLAAFAAISAVWLTWGTFESVLLSPLLAIKTMSLAQAAFLVAVAISGWFSFSLAMKLVKGIVASLRVVPAPDRA